MAEEKPKVRAPLWFRIINCLFFCLWISLQIGCEIFNVKCLQSYVHLSIFYNDREIDGTFLNIVIIGLLSTALVLGFVYGMIANQKLLLFACLAFLTTLLILNLLALAVLVLSDFSLDIGKSHMDKKGISIYHKNVSSQHLYHEIETWSQMFPLAPNESIEFTKKLSSASGNNFNRDISSTPHYRNTEAPLLHNMSTLPPVDRASDSNDSTSSTFFVPNISSSEPTIIVSTPPTIDLIHHREQRKIWYKKTEHNRLTMLGFLQIRGYCCGIKSIEDYALRRAQPAGSCRCHKRALPIRPKCSDKRYRLATGEVSAAWVQGCETVIEKFMFDLTCLRVVLGLTAIAQMVVILLSIVQAMNMPDDTTEDSEAAS